MDAERASKKRQRRRSPRSSAPRSSRGATRRCSSACPGPGLGGPPVRASGTPEQKKRFFSIFDDMSTELRGARTRSPSRAPGATSPASARAAARTASTGSSTVASASSRTARARRGTSSSRRSIRRSGAPGTARSSSRRARRASASAASRTRWASARARPRSSCSRTAACRRRTCSAARSSYTTKEGFMTAMKTFDNTRPLVAAMAHRHRPRGVRVRVRLREGALRALAPHPALRGHRRAPRARRSRPRGGAHGSRGARRGWPTQGEPNAKEASMSQGHGRPGRDPRVHRGDRDLRRRGLDRDASTSSSRSGSATSRSTTSSRAPGRSSASSSRSASCPTSSRSDRRLRGEDLNEKRRRREVVRMGSPRIHCFFSSLLPVHSFSWSRVTAGRAPSGGRADGAVGERHHDRRTRSGRAPTWRCARASATRARPTGAGGSRRRTRSGRA